MQCPIDLGTAPRDELFVPEANRIPPISFFQEGIPDWVEDLPAGRLTMGAFNCDGQFYSLMGQDSVPFTTGYPGMSAPIAAGATSYYMNERLENALAVRDEDDEIVYIAAGPMGFAHSPAHLSSEDDLHLWHDRMGLDGMERALARGRVYTDGDTVYMVGALQGDITNGEAYAISQNEVSPEFALIDEWDGVPAHLEYVALSMVLQGNTRSSASTDARVYRMKRSELNVLRANVDPPPGAEWVTRPVGATVWVPRYKISKANRPVEEADTMSKDIEARLAALEGVQRACACSETPEVEDAEVSNVDERLTAVEAGLAGSRMAAARAKVERQKIMQASMAKASADAGVERAGMELHSERRWALATQVYNQHDGYTDAEDDNAWVDVWVADVDDNYVYFDRYVGRDNTGLYRQSYTTAENGLTVTLGETVEPVVRDTRMVAV